MISSRIAKFNSFPPVIVGKRLNSLWFQILPSFKRMPDNKLVVDVKLFLPQHQLPLNCLIRHRMFF